MNPDGAPTYPLDVAKIKQLRLQKGMSWAALAKATDVHPGTLKRWIAGREARLGNIGLLAKALGTTADQLIRADEETGLKEYFDTEIVKEGELKTFQPPDIASFLKAIQEAAKAKRPMFLLCVLPGNSIHVELQIHRTDVLRLVSAFMAGKLKSLGILSIFVLRPSWPIVWDEWSARAQASDEALDKTNISSQREAARKRRARKLSRRWKGALRHDRLLAQLPPRCRLVFVSEVSPTVPETAPAELPFVLKPSQEAGTTDPIVVLKTDSDSGRLVLEASAIDALRLVYAFREGRLTAHGLRSVTVFRTEDAVEAVSPYPKGTFDFTIVRSDNEILVKANLPGFDDSELDVALSTDDALTMHAEIEQKSGEVPGGLYDWYGRAVIPGCKMVDFDAEYADGILQLHIYQKAGPRPGMIETQRPELRTDTEPDE